MIVLSSFASADYTSPYEAYTLDDSDLSGSIYTGACLGIEANITGTISGYTGIVNEGILLNSATDQVATGVGSGVFGLYDEFSVSLWFNSTENDANANVLFGVKPTDIFYEIQLDWTTNYIGFYAAQYVSGTTGDRGASCPGLWNTYDDGNWHHMVVTNNGGLPSPSTLNFYIDGVNVTTSCSTDTWNAGSDPSNITFTGSFTIGHRDGITDALNSNIDEVYIYRETLTLTDILALNSSRVSGYQPCHVVTPTNLTINLSMASPYDGIVFNDSQTIDFNTLVNATNEYNCSLIIDGVMNQSLIHVAGLEIPANFSIDIDRYDHDFTWYINCYDVSNSVNTTLNTFYYDTADALLGLGYSIPDFNFSSNSDYKNVSNIQINVTGTSKDIIGYLTFNVEKYSVSGVSNDVYMRVLVDNVTIKEQLVRSVSGLTIGSTGMDINFTKDIGIHNMTIQVRGDKPGKIGIRNFNIELGELESVENGKLSGYILSNTTTGTFNTLSDIEKFTFASNITGLAYARNLVYVSNTVDSVAYFVICTDKSCTKTFPRSVDTGTGTITVFGYVNVTEGDNNVTFKGYSLSGDLTVNSSISMFETMTPYRDIPKFNVSLSDETSGMLLKGDILNLTFRTSTDSVLLSLSASLNSSVTQDIGLTVNVYNSTGLVCADTIERTVDENVGNVFFNKIICPGYEFKNSTDHYARLNTADDNLYFLTTEMSTFAVSLENYSITPDTVNPSLIITYPDLTVKNDSNGTITGTCSDDSIVSSVSINDTDFNFSGDFNSWTFTFNNSVSDNRSVNITCRDIQGNSNSTVIDLYLDVIFPSCTGISSETIGYNASYNWSVSCSDDLKIYSFNLTCLSSSYNFSHYVDSVNVSSLVFNNMTDNLTEDLVCTGIICDGHTDYDISLDMNQFNVMYSKNDKTVTWKGVTVFDVDDTGAEVSDIKLDFTRLDRVKFTVVAENKGMKGYTFRHRIKNDKVMFIPDSIYPGWFVINDHIWLDFESDDIYDLKVWIVGKDEYIVEYKSDKDTITFNSMGLINCNSYTQTIDVSPLTATTGLEVNVCPDTTAGMLGLILICAISFGLILMALVFNIGALGFLGSLLLMTIGWVLAGCWVWSGSIIFIVSLFMILYFTLIRQIIPRS